jgi:hypothetical protein
VLSSLKKASYYTVEAEKFQQEYQTRYQQIGQRQQTLQGQHLENQAKAIDDIQKRINEYLKEYNVEGKYNFIFSTHGRQPNALLQRLSLQYYPSSSEGSQREITSNLRSNSRFELILIFRFIYLF